jgi:hypothetical protein
MLYFPKQASIKGAMITAADFHADMAERWQCLMVKTCGTLFGKTFIPFRKEGDIRDDVIYDNHYPTTEHLLAVNQTMDCPKSE